MNITQKLLQIGLVFAQACLSMDIRFVYLRQWWARCWKKNSNASEEHLPTVNFQPAFSPSPMVNKRYDHRKNGMIDFVFAQVGLQTWFVLVALT